MRSSGWIVTMTFLMAVNIAFVIDDSSRWYNLIAIGVCIQAIIVRAERLIRRP